MRRETKRLRAEEDTTLEATYKSIAQAKRLKTQRISVKERSKKLLLRVINKLDKEDSIIPRVPRDSSLINPITINFLFSENPVWNFFSKTSAGESSNSIGSPLVPIYYFILNNPSTLPYTLAYYSFT